MAVTAVLGLAACARASHTGVTSRTASTRRYPAWLLTRAALVGLTANQAVDRKLERSSVYEILRAGQRPFGGVDAKPVVAFASAAVLEDAVSRGQLRSATYGVLYDPEAWTLTPSAEQRDPVGAASRAAAVAHAHGLRLIVAPALDLTDVLEPGSREPRWRRFVELRLAARLARIADVVELQAQSLERQTAVYVAFVRAASGQARAANHRIAVLAGLSTNPTGAPVSGRQLSRAIAATDSTVEGYWLNIPGRGPRCPTCGAARPDVAIRALLALQ